MRVRKLIALTTSIKINSEDPVRKYSSIDHTTILNGARKETSIIPLAEALFWLLK